MCDPADDNNNDKKTCTSGGAPPGSDDGDEDWNSDDGKSNHGHRGQGDGPGVPRAEPPKAPLLRDARPKSGQ